MGKEGKMDEISPLFAIQAEKALKANNPQLALEICRRGIQFFPEYQIGYVLMAEAYEMMGNTAERDKLIDEIHQKFPKAITTKAIENKIKSEGTLIQTYDNDVEVTTSKNEIEDKNLTTETEFIESKEWQLEKTDTVETPFMNLDDEISNLNEDKIEQNNSELEIVDIDELIEQAQSVIEDIEETIQDLEDEFVEKTENVLSEELIMSETSTANEEDFIQEFAEMESEISDLQVIATTNPESVVEFSEELIDIEAEESPFMDEKHELANSQINFIDFYDIDLIPGINYLPFKFDYEEIIIASQNITLGKYNETFDSQPVQENDIKEKDINYIEEVSVEFPSVGDKGIGKQIEDESNDATDDFIPTETLAMIYEKQGKYLQAIEIYQKLMEIHPEKMEHYLNKIMLLETDS